MFSPSQKERGAVFPFPGGWGAAGLCAPLQELPHGTSGLTQAGVQVFCFLFFIFLKEHIGLNLISRAWDISSSRSPLA